MAEYSSKNSLTSNATQNQLIDCCGNEILSVITSKIQQERFYNILFDETTDKANIAQLTLVFRYTDTKEVNESFIKFIDIREENFDSNDLKEPVLSGIMIGDTVIKPLKNLNLNLENYVAICTDGCAP